MADMMMDSVLVALKKEIAKEEDFCVPDVHKSDCLKPLLKLLFDESSAATGRSFGPLTTLIVEGLDEESIWEELQTRTKPLARFVEKKLKIIDRKLSEKKSKLQKRRAHEERLKRIVEEEESEEDQDDEVTDGDNSEDIMDDDDFDNEEDEGVEDDNEDEDEDEVDGQDEEINDFPQQREGNESDFIDDVKMEAWLDAFEELEQQHKDKMEKKEKRSKASTVESRVS
jgi:U3 small nucleolar RNA-associated protein MPP10